MRGQVEFMSARLGQHEEELVLLSKPEENVLDSSAASLVSLGKYYLTPLQTLRLLIRKMCLVILVTPSMSLIEQTHMQALIFRYVKPNKDDCDEATDLL